MDLIRVFSEASRIGNRRFRLSVWYIENQTAAVDYEILYLAYSGNTDAGSGILYLFRYADPS